MLVGEWVWLWIPILPRANHDPAIALVSRAGKRDGNSPCSGNRSRCYACLRRVELEERVFGSAPTSFRAHSPGEHAAVLHLVEISVWAAAFTAANVLPDFETSLYYSLKSYTTVGYGDVLPPNSWRLLGPFEAAVGILMLGWSTGIIVAAVQRIYNNRSSDSIPTPRP